jgi:hypothetical protein
MQSIAIRETSASDSEQILPLIEAYWQHGLSAATNPHGCVASSRNSWRRPPMAAAGWPRAAAWPSAICCAPSSTASSTAG